MIRFLTILLLLSLVCAFGCARNNNKPNFDGVTPKNIGRNRCGLDNTLARTVVAKYIRGPVNGAKDENFDGKIDVDEAFTQWDFYQTSYTLQREFDYTRVQWTNIDTCYRFEIIPEPVFEKPDMKPIWRTCRSFTYTVWNNVGVYLGSQHATACRNFGTHEWKYL